MIRRFRRKKGIVLIIAYSAVAALIVLGAVVLQRSVNESNLARRNQLSIQALYIAEGGVECITYLLAYNIANYTEEPTTASDTDWQNIPNLPAGYLPADFTLQYTLTYEDAEQSTVDGIGINKFIRHYKVRARAVNTSTDVSIIINQIIQRSTTFTFQHAVFYTDDLEMLPGADMTLSGRVHSNNDIYVGSDGSTLKIDSEYMYSAGNIYNRRKNNGLRVSGDVSILIKDSSPASYEYMEIGGEYLDSDYPTWTADSQSRWGGTVKSSVHGVTSLAVPSVASIQPDGYYADQAGLYGLKIIRKASNTWEIYSGGTLVDIADLPADTITESQFVNHREGTTVTVTDIDVDKLNTSGYYPSNGLLYATDVTSSNSNPNGIRFKEADELSGSLTIVSNDPVYIQGDYNTTNKQPAAVICDAVNILSNNWDDSVDDYSSRYATDTNVNTAFISGIVPTPDGGGTYSGGLENYPRFLEKWSGKNLHIRGSFVELWESQIAQGDWQYGDPQYTAPYRDWDYDSDFNNSSNLPPFTPFAVETERLLWWKG